MTNAQDVYEVLLQHEIKWRIDGLRQIPTLEDVEGLLDSMVADVKRSPHPISIESGSLLVKRSDNHIDVYVRIGGVE